MTHFNHEWNGNALPEAIGDRYYAQDLNDDFNYLKHLPYEVFLQGRSRGVMITPTDTWDSDTDSITLSGGFGVILQDNLCVDPDENFTIPPITKSSPRYERIPFVDTTLALPNDNAVHYIVATPTKRSLLQRIKTTLLETYASRIRYDGVITIQDTAPTAGQILVGLCHNKEYCLLIDSDINQCKDSIIINKWVAGTILRYDVIIPILQSYYNTTVDIISNCYIYMGIGDEVDEMPTFGIQNGKYKNCIINGKTGGAYNNIESGVIIGGEFENCTIDIPRIIGTSVGSNIKYGIGISGGTFTNCKIKVGYTSVVGGSACYCIRKGIFYNCYLEMKKGTNAISISDNSDVSLSFCRITVLNVTPSLSNTDGKLNILNNSVLHAS